MRWIAQSVAVAGVCAAGLVSPSMAAAQPGTDKPTMATPPAKPDKPAMATPPAAADKANKGPGGPGDHRDHKDHKDGKPGHGGKDAKAEKGGPAAAGKDPAEAASDKAGRKDFKARLETLRKDRKERRRAQSDALIRLWGKDVLARPPVRSEIEHHAWRMARLERMKTLLSESDNKNKTKLLARIDKLIERENERHKKHMDALRAGNPAATAAGSTPANPGGATPPTMAKAPLPTAQPVSKTGSTPAAPAGGAQ